MISMRHASIFLSQINDWPFHQTLCFVHYIFDIQLKKSPRHDNNEKYMVLVDIQQSHPQITLYWEVIFFSLGGRI